MIYELSAQLGTLGLFATTIAGEVRRILDKVNEIVPPKGEPKEEKIETEPVSAITGTENLEVEIVGPFIGKEGDSNIPFAPKINRARLRDALSSVSVIPTPAFLHRNGGRNTEDSSSKDIFSKMSYREQKEFRRTGLVPERFRLIK
jgi:hypothetical protein